MKVNFNKRELIIKRNKNIDGKILEKTIEKSFGKKYNAC